MQESAARTDSIDFAFAEEMHQFSILHSAFYIFHVGFSA